MKNRMLAGIGLILCLSVVNADEGYEIMKRLDDEPSPRTTHALIRMILKDHRGRENERIIEQWSAEDNQGDTHSVMVFHRPASVKNTRFLSKENQNRDDDQWIFLPSLNRTRRIAGSEGDSSFMGTEFTYDDLASRQLDDYDYNYLGSGVVQGYNCFMVESQPKSETDGSYYKTISWITQDAEINSVVKIEFYESETDIYKVMVVDELKLIDSYWIPARVTMTNEESKRSTILIQDRLDLDRGVNSARFSQRFLETGRVN